MSENRSFTGKNKTKSVRPVQTWSNRYFGSVLEIRF